MSNVPDTVLPTADRPNRQVFCSPEASSKIKSGGQDGGLPNIQNWGLEGERSKGNHFGKVLIFKNLQSSVFIISKAEWL